MRPGDQVPLERNYQGNGSKGSVMVDGSFTCPAGVDYVSIDGVEDYPMDTPKAPRFSYWYPEGHPSRPSDVNAGDGQIRQRLSCVGANGAISTRTQSTAANLTASTALDVPELTCPDGSVIASFGADWVPGTSGVPEQTIVPQTTTAEWAQEIPGKWPACMTEECFLQLWDAHANESCGELAVGCLDWYVSATRAADYECRWGPYEVDLSFCSVFRDPGSVQPNATVTPGGQLTRVDWPTLNLTSGVAERAIERARTRYTEDACAALGEAVRPRVEQVSVPDMVLVCMAQGIAPGLNFALRSWPSTGPSPLVTALVETADGDPITILEPECNHLALDGRCLDEEGPETEPEPEPAGSGVRPPPNCLDGAARQQLIDSMDVEVHHMATHYGEIGKTFQQIADKYQLDVKTGAWNMHAIPHAGPHPWNYHNWVLQRMRAADLVAQAFPEDEQADVFLAEFERNVVDVVKEDPTVVRAAYWKCRDYYRWR
jgi:hypothetical protein